MTDYLDSGTISGTTSITQTESTGYVDSATINPKTSISSVELSNYIEATVNTNTSIISANEIAAFIDSATIESISELYTALVETFIITTHDYDFNSWTPTVSSGGSFPIAGSVGANDKDDGKLI